MREIFFRGQSVDDKKWVYGNYIHTDCYSECNDYIGQNNPFEHEVISETVGQYTGLTDKNGKKIFEGDIVKVKYDNTVGIVCFGRDGGGNLGFYIKWVGTHDYLRKDIAFWIDEREEIEVIGNIYDNPELLKESE